MTEVSLEDVNPNTDLQVYLEVSEDSVVNGYQHKVVGVFRGIVCSYYLWKTDITITLKEVELAAQRILQEITEGFSLSLTSEMRYVIL